MAQESSVCPIPSRKISDPEIKIPSVLSPQSICKQEVKVRGEIEEDDPYDYGRSSLQSLKAFDWLSLDHYSSDESLGSVVRIPGSDLPKSMTPGLKASKEVNKNRKAIMGGGNKYVRATSAPRLRSHAISSSPDRNNKVIRSKTQTRRELLSPLRSHDSCPDRHTRCKISPVPRDAEFSPQHSHDKHMMESEIYSLFKGRPTPAVEKRPKKTDNKPRFS